MVSQTWMSQIVFRTNNFTEFRLKIREQLNHELGQQSPSRQFGKAETSKPRAKGTKQFATSCCERWGVAR